MRPDIDRGSLASWPLASLLLMLWLLVMAPWAWAAPDSAAALCTAQHAALADASAVLRLPPDTPMTPADIQHMPASAFAPVSPRRFLGITPAHWWLRITLQNTSERSCQRWLQIGPTHLHDVRVYLPQADGWQQLVAGSDHPYGQWPLNERRPVFPVTLAPGTTHIVAQVVTDGEITSLNPQLWDPVTFQAQDVTTALRDGLSYGLLILLVVVSLFLAVVFRRWSLSFMALTTAFYVGYEASQKNYLLVYLWPDAVVFNMWTQYVFIGLHFATLFGYFYHMVRIQQMGRWQWLFYPLLGGFGLIALLGGLPGNTEMASPAVTILYQSLLWLLAVWYGVRWLIGLDRRWFPLLFLGAFCFRSVTTFAPLLGLDFNLWGGNLASTPMITILGIFLFGTLLSQMYQQRQQQLRANRALVQQRVTENERLERTVIRRTAELDRALQARRQLLGRISHDLRAPLVGVLDSVRQWHNGDDRHDHPGLIERNVHQQMAMIDELLEFSRTELSELEPEPIAGYLYAFLNEVAEQAELAAEHNGNRLQRDFAADLPGLVSLDFHCLRRVLINLLGNAGKYTERGAIRFAVAVLPSADGNDATRRLHFSIEDNGPGIGATERERLLQPYARGSSATQVAGHGLGLAIVTQLLHRLGGELAIDDAPGGGSRFHFELSTELATESDLEPIIEAGETITIDGADRVVLVVDDEPQQREITCDLLDGYGFDSVAASDGPAALKLLQTQSVDLVLTDQYMPGMDGWGLLQALRKHDPALPVVLYSSVPARPPQTSALSVTFDATLLKPVSGATLVNQVATLARHADDPAAAAPTRRVPTHPIPGES